MAVLTPRRAGLRPAGIALILVLLVAALAGANLVRARREPPGTRVTIERAGRSTVEATVNAMGTLRPREEVRVRSPLSGTVEAVGVREGSAVEEGQVLLTFQLDALEATVREAWLRLVEARSRLASLELQVKLEPELFSLELWPAEARLRQARAACEEARDLPAADPRRTQAEESLNQAEADYELLKLKQESRRVLPEALNAARTAAAAAESAHRIALDQLERATVRSPMTGVVTAVQVEAGAPVAAGASLLTVADLSSLRAEVRVDELDVGLVSEDQTASVYPGAFLDRGFPGTVTQVAPAAEMEGKAARFRVTILVENPEGLLRPGMTVDAYIVAERAEDALAVPLQALLGNGGEHWVLIFGGGSVERRPVVPGIRSATRVEICEGLAEGERVITGPLHLLDRLGPGDRVWTESAP